MESNVQTMQSELRPSERGGARVGFWGVIAGAVIAFALQIVFTVLGSAIGLSAIQPTSDVAQGVGIGFTIWMLITLCISAFTGALCASFVDRSLSSRAGLLNGFLVWSFVSLAGLAVVGSTLTSAVGGVFGLAGGAASTAAQSPAAMRQMQGAPGIQDRLAAGAESARRALQDPEQQRQAASTAATGVAIGLWGLFVLLLIPLGASLLGGWLGSRREAKAFGREPSERGEGVTVRRAPYGPPLETPT